MAKISELADGGNLLATDELIVLRAGGNVRATFSGSVASEAADVVSDTTPQLGGNLDTNGNDVTFGDNDKAIFGADSDLQIYHDGTNSYVQDSGTGDLWLAGTQVRIANAAGDKTNLYSVDGGQVSIRYNGVEKLATTSTGIDVTGVITTDGMTTSADINFGDNVKATFGADSDLQIYHNGSHSLISETGTGNLYIQGSSTVFLGSSSQNQVVINDGSDVKLRHNGSDKLATTATGIDVTGSVTADDSMLVEGASGSTLTLKNTTTGAGQGVLIGTVDFFNSDTSGEGPSVQARIKAVTANAIGNGADLQFFTTDASGGSEGDPPVQRMEIDQLGDISFYNDAGTSQDLYWDASTSRLGLGTTAPSYDLSVVGSSAAIQVDNTAGSPDQTLMVFQADMGTNDRNFQIKSPATDSVTEPFRFFTGNSFAFEIDTKTDAFVIGANANVGIGTSSPATELHVDSSTTTSSITLRNTTGTAGLDLVTSGTGGFLFNRNNDALVFGTNNSEKVRIDASGNVGIGTSSPRTKLHVSGLTGDDDPALSSSTAPVFISNTANSYGLNIGVNNSGTSWLQAQSNTASTAYKLSLNPLGGNVGIGTVSPSLALDVHGSGDTAIRVYSSGTGASDDTILRSQIGGTTASNYLFFGDSEDNNAGQIRYVHSDDSMRFAAGATTERLRLYSTDTIFYNGTTEIARFDSSDNFHLKGGAYLMGTGTANDQTSTIQAALDAAEPYSIVRLAGEFGYTSLTIGTEGLTLIVDGVLKQFNSTGETSNGTIQISASHVTVQGGQFDGNGTANTIVGVLSGADYCTVRDGLFKNVDVDNSMSATGGDFGAVLIAGDFGRVENCTFTDLTNTQDPPFRTNDSWPRGLTVTGDDCVSNDLSFFRVQCPHTITGARFQSINAYLEEIEDNGYYLLCENAVIMNPSIINCHDEPFVFGAPSNECRVVGGYVKNHANAIAFDRATNIVIDGLNVDSTSCASLFKTRTTNTTYVDDDIQGCKNIQIRNLKARVASLFNIFEFSTGTIREFTLEDSDIQFAYSTNTLSKRAKNITQAAQAEIETPSINGAQVGMTVTIAGATPSGYNGTYTVQSVVNSKKYTINLNSSGLAAYSESSNYGATATLDDVPYDAGAFGDNTDAFFLKSDDIRDYIIRGNTFRIADGNATNQVTQCKISPASAVSNTLKIFTDNKIITESATGDTRMSVEYAEFDSPFMFVQPSTGVIRDHKNTRPVFWSSSAPSAGTYQDGTLILNSATTGGGRLGYARVGGTWKGFGRIGDEGTETADNFRSASTNTSYNLLARNGTGTALYVQQAGSGALMDLRTGSMTANQGTSRFLVDNSGNVGIGVTPARSLHVSDVMRLEPTSAPSSPSAGDIYFDSSTSKLRCYDGSAWNDLF